MQWDSKEKAKEKGIVEIAYRRDIFPESAPISRQAKARAKDSKENAITAVRKAIPQESAPMAKKEESKKEK